MPLTSFGTRVGGQLSLINELYLGHGFAISIDLGAAGCLGWFKNQTVTIEPRVLVTRHWYPVEGLGLNAQYDLMRGRLIISTDLEF